MISASHSTDGQPKGGITINSRERFLTALNCEQPDRVPVWEMYMNGSSIVRVHDLLNPDADTIQSRQDLTGQEGEDVMAMYCDIVEQLDLDGSSLGISVGLVPEGEKAARDKFGTLHELSDLGEPYPLEGPIESEADLEGFDMAAMLEEEDFAQVSYIRDRLGSDRAHVVQIPDPYKISWRLRGGMEPLLMEYATSPRLIHGLKRIATDYCLVAMDMAADLGVDVIVMPGDLAGEENLIMSPAHYREFIKPYQAEIVQHAHDRGLKIIKHSDGNMWPILDDLIEIGFDGFHPVQPQSMDIGEVKQHLAGKACVLGNIDCRELLVYGTEAEVEASVEETIEAAAPGGGYIICSSNSIHPSCKPENFIALTRAAHRFGSYE